MTEQLQSFACAHGALVHRASFGALLSYYSSVSPCFCITVVHIAIGEETGINSNDDGDWSI
jgi:hypothetical protein